MLDMNFKFGKQLKIYLGVLLLQFGFAGFAIVAKFALNEGTSHYTFSVYRNAIAAVVFAPFAFVLERKIRPKMTFSILYKIMLRGLLDPIIGQNLFYAGMDYTTATFTTAMCNVLPGLTFLMAWILSVGTNPAFCLYGPWRKGARRVHERSKEVNFFQIYNMDSGNAM